MHAAPHERADSESDDGEKHRGEKTRQEILSDIGLGKRLPVVVARRLVATSGQVQAADAPRKPDPITIHGTEGMAVQFAGCCSPMRRSLTTI